MTNLAIVTKSEIASFRAAGVAIAAGEGKLEAAMVAMRDESGKYSRVTEEIYNMLRDDAQLAYIAKRLGLCGNVASDAAIEKARAWDAENVKGDNAELRATYRGAFRVNWFRACGKTGFPVYGKNAGNTNKTGKGKNAAGAPATGKGKGKGAATPQNAPVAPVMVAPAKVTAKDIATASKAIGGLGDLDRAFRRAAALLDAVAKKNAKLEGSQPYVELAARLYSELAKLPIVE